LPHAGTGTQLWSDVVALGNELKALAHVADQKVEPARIAIVFDYDSWWALSQRNLPSTEIDYPDLVHEWYSALWQIGARVDFIPAGLTSSDLRSYDLVLLPMAYLMSDREEDEYMKYAASGGSLVVSYFTGISDRDDHVKTGGYGGRLVRETLGVFVEEFHPVAASTTFQLDNGLEARQWCQAAKAGDASEAVLFATGPNPGAVAIAETRPGNTASWYLGTRLTPESNRAFFATVVKELGIQTRGGNGSEYIHRGTTEFQIDHNKNLAEIIVGANTRSYVE